MQFERKQLSNDRLREIYHAILLPRMIEEKMLILLRQGRITKWFSGIGQEAIAVGSTLALHQDEWIMPLHRNLGVFTTRGIPFHKLIDQWQGHADGFTKGRDRSFHFGTPDYHICGMISHLGPQLSVADGAALAYKLKNEKKVSLAYTGEGGTSEGEFHEALNIASVWDLPVIFIVENNGYGLSTPTNEQYRCEHIVDRAKGYGMEGVRIDGNNILTVMDTVEGVREYCIREQRPYMIECETFRMRGHEEASGVKYVPKELFEKWIEKDPVKKYEQFLLSEGVLDSAGLAAIRDEIKNYIESEIQKSALDESRQIVSYGNVEDELNDVYVPADSSPVEKTIENNRTGELRFVDAIKEGLHQSMQVYGNLVLMGQDIAEYGGVFKITEGFVKEFGRDRVRNTPLCESGIVGTALGLSLEGFKSMVEMQFADFVSVGFNQIVNNLAKIHYRWAQNADVVVRMPCGAGVGAGPFHSQSNEAWFTHVPGLKVVYPASPEDAKGLLIAAIQYPGPVMFFEHKHLYRSLSSEVPAEYYATEIGKANVVRTGTDVSVITYGLGVVWAREYADKHPDVSIEILDLRTLVPLDYKAIKQTVSHTGKVLILHEDTMVGGFGGEIASWVAQHCFEYLDAPVMRCASLDTPVPFSGTLEKQFLAENRLGETIEKLLKY
ncbi:MAG: dehydrogenase E1 component subunit alpha/beta [Chitinophagaceae bacterium]|nr:dehydrogenase E1 component subunit alpha/beta [Chitinophagaceae bacterium]